MAAREWLIPHPMNLPLPLVLASSSPRRVQLVRDAGLSFSQDSSGVDESAIEVAGHSQFAMVAALLKARDVAQRTPHPAIILGADTIVCLDDRRLASLPIASRLVK